MLIQQFLSIVTLTWREQSRTRLGWLLYALMLVDLLIAVFVAGLAVTESDAHRLVIYAGIMRLAAVFVIGLHVTSSIARDFDDRVIDLVLSRPVPRGVWYAGRYAGFASSALLLSLVLALPLAFGGDAKGVLVWALSLGCELCIVVACCLACAVTLQQVPAAFSAFIGFYVLSRAIADIALISTESTLNQALWSNQIIARGVAGLAYLLPDLYRFTLSGWPVYGPPNGVELGSIAIQTGIYTLLLLAVGLFDLYRKNL